MTGVLAGRGLLFAPFRGLHYADPASLAQRLAPPYDVVSPSQRRELAKQDRANIVHLDLPTAPPGEDPYQEAARLLESWQRRGILVRDREPSAYVLRTTSRLDDGSEISRTGVLLAAAAVSFATGGRVRPHEQTHSEAKEDRRRLTLATGCNLSPVFMLTPDSRGDLSRALREATEEEPWATAEALGSRHEVWLVAGQPALRIATLASDDVAYIADGHHRYETALGIREEVPSPWKLGALRTLAHVVSFKDPGLRILPTHRVVEGRPLDRAAVLKAATPFFARALPGELPALRVLLFDGSEATMTARAEADLSAAEELPLLPPARGLPTALADAVLIRVVLAGLIGGVPRVRYTPSETEAREAALSGKAALAVLVRPTTLDEVRAVSDAGQFMPPKSTFFAPKVPTGIVLRMLAGEM